LTSGCHAVPSGRETWSAIEKRAESGGIEGVLCALAFFIARERLPLRMLVVQLAASLKITREELSHQ
jgi:hypothetical protein